MSRMMFNPALVPIAQRASQFVVRGPELGTILSALQRAPTSSNQHFLVLGARGFGKSTLVHRVVAELHRDAALGAAWFALVFPEEAYEVGNEGELWLEAVHRLAIASRDPHWERRYAELRKEHDVRRLSEQARQTLRAFAEQRQCRLLLVIENLDSLLGDQLSDQDAWALRKVLQDDPTFLLLATAVRRFPGVEQHDKAFYQAFRRVELTALEPSEISTVWSSVTGQVMPLRRAQAVRVLTGGNPRLIQILAGFWRSSSVRTLFDDLTGLVDQHTDTFRGNIEAISGQQRRVFLALAALWRPATAGEVAKQARTESSHASVELGRLVSAGRVDVVSTRGRVKRYQVAERLYNIYYLLRQGGGIDARVRALADFMVGYYDADALRGALNAVWHGADQGELSHEQCADLVTALLTHSAASDDVRVLLVKESPAAYFADVDKAARRGALARPSTALAALARADAVDHGSDVARALSAHVGDPAWDDVALGLAHLAEGRGPLLVTASEHLARRPPAALRELCFDGHLAAASYEFVFAIGSLMALAEGEPSEVAAWHAAGTGRQAPDAPRDPMLSVLAFWLDPARAEVPSAAALEVLDICWLLLVRALQAQAWAASRALLAGAQATSGEVPWVVHLRVVAALVGDWDDPGATAKLAEQAGPEAAALRAVVNVSDPVLAATAIDDARVALVYRAWIAWRVGHARAADLAFELARTGDLEGWRLLSATAPHRLGQAWRELDDVARAASAQHFVHAGCTIASVRPALHEAAALLDPEDPSLRVALTVNEAIVGRLDASLAHLEVLLNRPDAMSHGRSSLIALCLALGASGVAEEVARAIAASPHVDVLTPLLLALDPARPEDEAAAEERTVAADLRARLAELRASEDRWMDLRWEPSRVIFPKPALPTAPPTTRKGRRQS